MGRRAGLFVTLVVAVSYLSSPAARAGRLANPRECRAGTAAPLTLGVAKGALAVCAGTVYVGGNPIYTCGTILVGDTALVGAADDDVAEGCDPVDPLDNKLRYDVALPAAYQTQPLRRWPVVYLLPGGGGDEHSWERFTDVVPKLTATGVIVVLPYGGTTFHTDWEIGEHRAYERAFVERLIPEVDARYRTLGDRAHRAIGGFSRGGFGAMLTAARHPDLFAAAGAFSGALDPLGELREEQVYLVAFTAGGSYDELAGKNPWFGNPVSDELGWRERSPVELASALSGTALWVSSGDGIPDADDTADPLFALSAETEVQIRRASARFHQALATLGIAHHYEVHHGVHDYANAAADVARWARQLQTSGFGRPTPKSFNLRNADAVFGAYGWRFAADKARAPEFLAVTGAGSQGVMLRGSGQTSVTTAALFAPNQSVDLILQGSRKRRRADSAGRLHFVVDLGRAHSQQEFTVSATAALQRSRTVAVTFKPT